MCGRSLDEGWPSRAIEDRGFLRRMSDFGWGADVRLLSFVIPDLIRDPRQRRSHGPRIKSGVTMINRAAIGRKPPLSSDMPGPPTSQLIRRSPGTLARRYCLRDR